MLLSELNDVLREMDKLSLEMSDESLGQRDELISKLEGACNAIKADPALLTDQVFDTLKYIAANSPYQDINEVGAEFRHQRTPAQDVSMYAVRVLETLAENVPQKSAQAIQCLEDIIRESLDHDMRGEAVMTLWILGVGQERDKAVAALERQGVQNNNAHIRTAARDFLLQVCTERAEFTPRAMAAQIKGVEDPDIKARTRALAMLKNRAVSVSCPEDEAQSLLAVFKKAAADNRSMDKDLQYWIERGLTETQKRLKEGPRPGSQFP